MKYSRKPTGKNNSCHLSFNGCYQSRRAYCALRAVSANRGIDDRTINMTFVSVARGEPSSPPRRRQAARIREAPRIAPFARTPPRRRQAARIREALRMAPFARTPPRRRQAARIREAPDMPQGMSGVHAHPSASAQIFFAQVIAYCPSNSLDCAETPPEPGTAFMVLATSSYLCTEATCMTLSAETKL